APALHSTPLHCTPPAANSHTFSLPSLLRSPHAPQIPAASTAQSASPSLRSSRSLPPDIQGPCAPPSSPSPASLPPATARKTPTPIHQTHTASSASPHRSLPACTPPASISTGSPLPHARSSLPSALQSTPTCKSHTPDVPASARSPLLPDSSPHIHSTLHSPPPHRSPAVFPASLPAAPAHGSASAPPPACCPPPCTATALLGKKAPKAHTLLPLSTPPAAPPPSPLPAPCTPPPAPPALLPALANNAPAGSLSRSTPHNSTLFLRTPPPPTPPSSPPPPQSTHAHNDALDTPSPSRSTPLQSADVLLLEVLPAYVPLFSVPPPAPPPNSAARTPCIRTPAPLPLPPPPAPLSGTLLLPDHPLTA